MPKQDDKFLNILYNIFGVMPKSKVKDSVNLPDIIPVEKNVKDVTKDPESIEYKNDLLKQYEYFLDQCSVKTEDIIQYKNRKLLLQDLRRENTIIDKAVRMLANEATAVQDNSNFIDVKTKNSKFGKDILSLLKKWEINQKNAQQEIEKLSQYGDSFRYRHISEKGIEKFNFMDVFDVKKRLEFSPLRMSEEDLKSISLMRQKFTSINDLVKKYEESSDEANYLFTNILVGFILNNDMIVPPWSISHTRLSTNDSEFFPHGRSIFINSISAGLQLKASKNLMFMARANNFPIEVWELTGDPNQSESEKWAALNRFIQNISNYTSSMSYAEQKGIKSSIFTYSNLFTYKLQESKIDLGDIADIEMIERDLIIPTDIPLNMLINQAGDGFASGKLLMQQSKPFSRTVYMLQQAYLDQLVEDIKIHYTITGEYDMEEEEFEIILQFPVVEETQDQLSAKQSSIEFAKAIIAGMKEVLGIPMETQIPEELIKEIFAKFSFLDIATIDSIIDQLVEVRPDESEVSYDNNINMGQEDNIPQMNTPTGIGNEVDMVNSLDNILQENCTTKKISNFNRITESQFYKIKRISESVMKDIYFKTKRDLNKIEGYANNKHYMMSFVENSYTNQVIALFKSNYKSRLKESEKKYKSISTKVFSTTKKFEPKKIENNDL